MSQKLYLQTMLLLAALLVTCHTVALASLPQSDDKAKALAQQVLQNMGGQKGWDDTRFLAWTFNDQYQVWDKHENRFRWEQDSLVVIIDTDSKEGKVYVDGRELQDQEQARKLREQTYARWINNSYWLVMPFKLQDPGVTLKYVGEGKTEEGAPADILEMTFENVGLTPQNKYHLWVDKEQGLVTQWAFFRNYADAKPTFTRRWSDYQTYGKIKLASDRSNPQSDFKLTHLAAPASVPDKTFSSPTAIDKASLK
ncbi:hypothetical protein [Pontibacter roseus]|uniref:hypothetical protein n=1 Tax=Pontibacter roseus TaxID=336989 RepID=UPI0003A78076|nr:hypothetical protein [Pontibacter roseus]